MSRLANRIVWLTGASTGIGRALAIELSRRGCRLALSARSAGALDQLAAELGLEKTMALPMDAASRDANLIAAETIAARFGGLDIAVLNAGICEYVDRENFESAIFERTMQTNFMSVVYGIEAALPALRRSSDPQIVGMSSTARYAAMPRAEAYGASKAAIAYLLESLRLDLLPDKIFVSVISPGFVRTPLTDRNDFPMPMIVEAEDAARIIADGIERRKREIAFPGIFCLALKALAMLPGGAFEALMKRTVRRA